ncbi:gamma-glutamylcyclotransferase 2-3 isoform X2 [Zingiber officinale]|uniref:gamma-glutamylcyclotransferase 2-3-like isoform X1 n=1 Tax=Zingiber officinale TaxID=94328 RepID=UPI001C4DD771|nr:gamma-glutamylcyclotransferase 2-3-like isoform X1 [Zingiber officinale]XP_042418224.1 gamma-glutamylcyclotransferase 2-3 isoform X2 [Zingiber officinale]
MAATWVFGYGSLIWKAGFHYDERRVGFVRGFRRVFYQGSTDHRGTPDFPGRTVTLEPLTEATCWGVAYRIPEEEKKIALEDEASSIPAINGVMVYIGSEDKKTNPNYLGPASLDEMARQIAVAEGPSGPNTDYLFHLEESLKQIGCEDPHVTDLVAAVRRVVSTKEGA